MPPAQVIVSVAAAGRCWPVSPGVAGRTQIAVCTEGQLGFSGTGGRLKRARLWLPQHSNPSPSRVPFNSPLAAQYLAFPISLALHPEILTCAQDLEEVLS